MEINMKRNFLRRITALATAIICLSVSACSPQTQEQTGYSEAAESGSEDAAKGSEAKADESTAAAQSDAAADAAETSSSANESSAKAEQEPVSSRDNVLKDLPTSWDLTELYANEDAFEADMKRMEELIPEIESIRGTLNSVEGILNDLENPELLEINKIGYKAMMYTQFLNSLDATDPWAIKAGARYNEVAQKVSLAYAFEQTEIMEMPLEKRQEIFSDERLAPYAYYMKNFTDPDYVVLSEEAKTVETLLGYAINNGDTHDIFDYIELPIPTFTYPDGSEGTLTDAEYAKIVESGEYDHEFRKEIYGLRNSMRAPYANTYASLLDGAMRANWAEAQIHKYDSTLEAALDSSDVDPKIYDKIIEFSHSLLPKVYEYYETKKNLLGLDEIMLCDLNLSVTDYTPKEISYEDAVNIGREGIAAWGDEYLEAFDKIITSPHIDVYPSSTKETGAYENLIGNETTPFVLYNFDGSESYISTIVHEMGHAVYSELSAENQNIYNCTPDIFTQEVASTANEIMFHNYMIENAKTKDEKLYWMDQQINLFLGTIVRQCLYSEFEDYCYKTIEGGGSLDADAMAQKWLELEKLYYGDKMTILDDSGIDWARIPHLYYDYYVYQYATSITYAASICSQVGQKGQEEIDDYLDFLKAGTTTSPAELLSIAGVDPLDDDTYSAAGELIENLIDEFTQTAME